MPDTTLVSRGLDFAEQLNSEVGLIDVARLSIGYIEAGIYPSDLEDMDRLRAEKTVGNGQGKVSGYRFCRI